MQRHAPGSVGGLLLCVLVSLVSLVSLGSTRGVHAQSVVHVPGDAPHIQAGIDLASDGDTVLVGPGHWYGPLLVSGKTLTLESSDGADATITDAGGLGSALYIDDSDLTLRGLTVTGGEADIGGGLRINASTVQVESCRIVRNGSVQRGGGIDVLAIGGTSTLTLLRSQLSRNVTAGHGGGLSARGPSCSVTMEDCLVEENEAQQGGGGLSGTTLWPSLTLKRCRLLRNVAGGDGGGMRLWDVPLEATDCDIAGNEAGGVGGGWSYVNLLGGLSPRMTDCRILRNRAASSGGGAHLNNQGEDFLPGAHIELSRCRISDNVAGTSAGGVLAHTEYSSVRLRDCVVSGNRAGASTAAVWTGSWHLSGASLLNSTIVDNHAPSGAAIDGVSASVIRHCIVHGNTGAQVAAAFALEWCNVEGGHPGLGNLDLDALFVDPSAGDYHLGPGSPCIDAGDPAFAPQPGELDIDGERRLQGGRVDIGADETTP